MLGYALSLSELQILQTNTETLILSRKVGSFRDSIRVLRV